MTSSLSHDPFRALDTFETGTGPAYLYRLSALSTEEGVDLDRLPRSIRILLEGALRRCDGTSVTESDVRTLATYNPDRPSEDDIPFMPSRVLLQDFTGVPAVVDLAALRSAMDRLGGSPASINPLVPVHLIIDHSVQVDHFGLPEAVQLNSEIEFDGTRSDTSSCAGDNRHSTTSASSPQQAGSAIRSTSSTWPVECGPRRRKWALPSPIQTHSWALTATPR